MAKSATPCGKFLRYLTLFLLLRDTEGQKFKGKWKKKSAKKAPENLPKKVALKKTSPTPPTFDKFVRRVNPEKPIGKINHKYQMQGVFVSKKSGLAIKSKIHHQKFMITV